MRKKKSIFRNKMTKVTLSPRTWAATYVCGPKHAYVGTFLGTKLGFQRHKKGKFSTIIAKVWNESHIIWEPFQTPFFSLCKALHGILSKHIEISREKYKIH